MAWLLLHPPFGFVFGPVAALLRAMRNDAKLVATTELEWPRGRRVADQETCVAGLVLENVGGRRATVRRIYRTLYRSRWAYWRGKPEVEAEFIYPLVYGVLPFPLDPGDSREFRQSLGAPFPDVGFATCIEIVGSHGKRRVRARVPKPERA
jgi:hypothetical protein